MSDPKTLYDSSMGDQVRGGNVDIKPDGSTHHTIYGDGWKQSWDESKSGEVSNDHGWVKTDDGAVDLNTGEKLNH